MKDKASIGELRAWSSGVGRLGTFIVIGIEGYRIDVILPNGKRDGFLRPYLESNSHVISEAETRKPKDR
jgi:hypothetical protein